MSNYKSRILPLTKLCYIAIQGRKSSWRLAWCSSNCLVTMKRAGCIYRAWEDSQLSWCLNSKRELINNLNKINKTEEMSSKLLINNEKPKTKPQFKKRSHFKDRKHLTSDQEVTVLLEATLSSWSKIMHPILLDSKIIQLQKNLRVSR